MSLALSGDTIAYLMGLGLDAEQMKGLIDRLNRDALAMAPPATTNGVNEERERLRNESTYAERKRAKDRERQRQIREAAKQSRDVAVGSRDVAGDPPATEGDVTPTSGDALPPPEQKGPTPQKTLTPTLPKESPLKGPLQKVSPNGSRLPEGWSPDEAGLAYAAKVLGPDIDPHRELDRFRDYWRAVPGAKGRKLDWPATWRNWCRNAAERLPRKAPHERLEHSPTFLRKQANYANAIEGARRLAEARRDGGADGPDPDPLWPG